MKNNELVFIEDGQAVTCSLKVAETFGKEHARVLRDIRELECSESFREGNFAESFYTNRQGRKNPKYTLTYDGFIFVVMSYTGKKAATIKEDYIKEFNRYRHALADKSEQLNELVEQAKVKDVSLEDINKVRFSEKRTIRTFENTTIEDVKKLVVDFTAHARQLDTLTRVTRCNSAIKGIQRLHDRVAKEGAVSLGDCYNLLLLMDNIKEMSHMTENRRNGGIKAYQKRQIGELSQTGS